MSPGPCRGPPCRSIDRIEPFVGGLDGDVYAFTTGLGTDRIEGFASGSDVIQLMAILNGSGIISAEQIVAKRVGVNASGEAVIDLGGGHAITPAGVAPSALTAADFLVA
ncbi:MAG: hypothetical protein FJX35_23120 [Alphaproteobacteria bacterium]|nr:hypothetical protein [Alphaproteobacteria bacterium]